MTLAGSEHDAIVLEVCVDELYDFCAGTLQHYAPAVVAVALRVHLEALLQSMLEAGACTREELREFLRGLEHEALQYEEG